MNDSAPDVQQILEYRLDTAFARMLPIGLGMCFLALLVFALDDRPPAEILLAGPVVGAAGLFLVGLAVWRRSHRGTPLFVLSPAGVYYRLGWLKTFLVPWHEVKGIETIEIESWNWSIRNPDTMTFSDVTALLLTKKFYDRHVHVRSWWWRGPGWKLAFIPKGQFVQMALHHEAVSAEPSALRNAVEARWRAFRGNRPESVGSAPTTRLRLPKGIAAGDDPKAISVWQAAVIVVLLIGIAGAGSNVLRLWATDAQTRTRAQRANWAEEERKMLQERREMQKRLDETDRRIKEMFRRF